MSISKGIAKIFAVQHQILLILQVPQINSECDKNNKILKANIFTGRQRG